MVVSIAEMNDHEWPSLKQPHKRDEWELLDPDEHDHAPEEHNLSGDSSFEVVIEADIPSPRRLHHSNSSPNLSSSTILKSPVREHNLGAVMEDEEESSFAMVSSPPSVWTATSTTTTGNLNYRNAILAATSEETTTAEEPVTSPRSKKNGLRKFQPRIVVVPTPPRMRRCSRSTGDLPTLMLDDQETANEFYQQKSMGMSSYSVGRKQRPDEMKRRNLIIQKKDRQRKGNP